MVAKMMLMEENDLTLVESVNADDARSEQLGIFDSNDVVQCPETVQDIIILSRAASNFLYNPSKPVPFHSPTSYTIARMLLGELRSVFVNLRTDSALELVGFLNTPKSHAHTTSISQLQMLLSCMRLHSYDTRD